MVMKALEYLKGLDYSSYVFDPYGDKEYTEEQLVDFAEDWASIKTKKLEKERLPIKFIKWYSGMQKYQIISAYERWKKENNQH